ncbi:adenylate/guanylate cyclase domain-containing protein [Bradyrhizobium sp. LHD-71]|uniref:adenylate/guanylate cyclase domain-containing protein n=1 Tax=Bradyrhizobium sp. LHD-71 TaxID=3072141 RepID=UPI00280EF910|nr:adenylate/guanylate cyclase domain-containing protein [Bradyrhizobium sp. LHD-71]MDQ8732035.1 adenylate/guanylate cyclase domain-containing protein [Bradyrhizobium sp. LHD-71]
MEASPMGLPTRAINHASSRAVRPDRSRSQRETLVYAEAALAEAKQQGLRLAVRARWVALAVIAVVSPIVNPHWEVLYYEIGLALFALIGWAQLQVGEVGRSRRELFLMFCDLALLTFMIVVPNPWRAVDWPVASQFHFSNFIFYFVLLAGATLAYSWRTVVAMGVWTTGLFCIGLLWAWFQPVDPAMTERIGTAIGGDQRLLRLVDPSSMNLPMRLQEIVVLLIVAATLALAGRRSNDLLLSHAALERERTNLARYFSPTVVKELSKNDEPLKQVRTQKVAVLFVDIVGFTAYADGKDPEEVIRTLREFHGLMEHQVFQHAGTLDKYLGDGLMATFGTPFSGVSDAWNALKCAQAMIATVADFNRERDRQGQPPIRAGFGLHYGPVVLGDIGAQRLEFAVIGSTVNAASRLEALTRELGCVLVASDALIEQVRIEIGEAEAGLGKLTRQPAQAIRGIELPMGIWIQA